MTHWKRYAGSILLAGLLLQGCGETTEEAAALVAEDGITTQDKFNASSYLISETVNNAAVDEVKIKTELTLKFAALDATNSEMQEHIDGLVADGSNNISTRQEAYVAMADSIIGSNSSVAAAPSRGPVLDAITDGLVDILDSSLGDAVTGAMFDVVLNSDGVTVFMLDQARNSQTMTDIMINALDENWDLTRKMCPMLQENAEFGEKFTALAYERPNLAQFFFEKIDSTMYGCLTDAMILSSDEENFGSYDDPVEHSTTGYMGALLETYATTYFIEPGTGAVTQYQDARTDKFTGLMFTTGDVVTVDGNVTSGHGDANELINEQFFYAMFRTPTSTGSFVTAMESVEAADPANVAMFMDEIFLGKQNTVAFGEGDDKVQGYYNIISIAGGMYEGIQKYGFGSYTDAFIGFAALLPSDRYMTYGSQFMGAGYFWAEQNGIDIWGSVVDGAKGLYAQYTAPEEVVASAAARTAGRGVYGTGTAWISDALDVVVGAWDASDLLGYFGSDTGWIEYYNNEALKAYDTVVGSPDSTHTTTIVTVIDGATYTDEVKGFHGLLELAIREDMVNSGGVANMTEAEAAFSLPAFSAITWDFAYNAAAGGVTAYWNNVVDAEWLADFSSNDLVRAYFYPTADNIYIPSWLMAIDWLKVPANMDATSYEAINFSFDGGYMDVYIVSANAALLTDIELAAALAPIKDNIEFTQVSMGADSIIAVDASGLTLEGLYVYKIRVVTPADTEAVLAALAALGNDALNAIGIDTDNAAQTTETATAG
ncbi:MAG: hypothetical protein WBF77_08385 [Sulfurimonadaceae bacterium]